MRKAVLAAAFFLTAASPLLAGDTITIRPQYPDLHPGDGWFEEGSYFNPYELRDSEGHTWEIRPLYPDLYPGDGFMEEGSYFNPYMIEE